MAKLPAEIELLLSNPNLNNLLPLRGKYDKETLAARQLATTIMSDIISEDIKGFGRETVKSEKSYFSTPAAAPDAAISVEKFEEFTGIKVDQSEVIKRAGADRDIAFFETKVKGVGKEPQVEITSASIGQTNRGKQFGEVQKALKAKGLKNLTQDVALDLLFTDDFADIRNQIINQTKEKFENFLLVSVFDQEKGGKTLLKFAKNPLKEAKFDKNFMSKHFDFRFRTVDERVAGPGGEKVKTGNVERYRVSISTKDSLYSTFKFQDIAKEVAKKQRRAVDRTFSKVIKDRIVPRLREFAISQTVAAKGVPLSAQKVTNTMAFLVAFAKEFEDSGLTPFALKQTVKGPPPLRVSSGLNVQGAGKKDRKAMQRFISGVQLTQLVQKRLGRTMERFGNPEAPNLKERSGRFRTSVEIIADYRKNIIAYRYNPLYDQLNKYGYKPSDQVGRATREVVQTLFARAFNIVRA